MAKNCKNKNCGACTDTSIGVPNTFSNNPSECPINSEPCIEVFETNCICWTGSNICELNIKKGDRLTSILDKIILAVKTNSCSSNTLLEVIQNLEIQITSISNITNSLQNDINNILNRIVYFVEGDSLSFVNSGVLDPLVDTLLLNTFEFINTSSQIKKFIINSNFTFSTSNNIIPFTGDNYGKLFKTDTLNVKNLLTFKRHSLELNINDPNNVNQSGANYLNSDYNLMYVVVLNPNEKVSLEFSGTDRVLKAQLLITEINN